MKVTINNNEYELSTKLGTTLKIETTFKRPYLKVIQDIENFTTEEQIKMMACGLIDKEENKQFKEDIFEEGIDMLTTCLEEFIDGLQFPGKTAEEIEEKKLMKIAKQKHLKEIGLIN